jgi:cell division protein FtsN
MARDYKNTTTSRRKKTSRKKKAKKSLISRLPTWFWFIAGVLATVAFMWMKTNWFSETKPAQEKDMTPLSSRMDSGNDDKGNAKTTSKPKNQEITKDPRFTFYERLPKDEIIIPQEALDVEVDKNKNKEPLENIEKSGSYVLQAGSFQEFSDADRRKAELALLGLESNIQKVSIDKRNWYRVRIGPYTNLDTLNDTRQRLRNGEIDVLVIRTK